MSVSISLSKYKKKKCWSTDRFEIDNNSNKNNYRKVSLEKISTVLETRCSLSWLYLSMYLNVCFHQSGFRIWNKTRERKLTAFQKFELLNNLSLHYLECICICMNVYALYTDHLYFIAKRAPGSVTTVGYMFIMYPQVYTCTWIKYI